MSTGEGWDPRVDEILDRFERLKAATKKACELIRDLVEEIALIDMRVAVLEEKEKNEYRDTNSNRLP